MRSSASDHAVKRAFGKRLKASRNRRKFSQRELAKRSGLGPTYIYMLEKGLRNPTLLVLLDLAWALRVNLRDLTGRP